MGERIIQKIGISNLRLTGLYFVLGYVSHVAVWIYRLGSSDANMTGSFHIIDTWEFAIGRWFIKPIDWFNNYLSDAIFTSTVTILLFAVGAVCVVNLLELDDMIFRTVCGGILMLSPCVAFTLPFFYCSIDYALSLVLACLFVYFIKKDRNVMNSLAAVLALVFSLGLYQAYLSTAAVLCLSLLLIMLLRGDEVRDVLNKGVYMGAVALVANIIYYAIMVAIIRIMGLQAASYNGADSLGQTSILKLKIAIAVAYKTPLRYLVGFSDIPVTIFYRNNIYFIILSACAFVALLILILRRKLYKQLVRMLLLIGLLVAFPLANGIILIATDATEIHPLMIYGLYVIFVILGVIVNDLQKTYSEEKIPVVIASIFLIFTCLYGYELYAIDNATYEYNNVKRNNVISTAQRILTEAEELEGYDKDIRFCFAGGMQEKYPIDTYLEKMSHQKLCSWESNVFIFNQRIIENIYRNDIGCKINFCDDNEYETLVSSEEFSNMPTYPEKGSLKITDGYVIVKLDENPLMPSGGTLYVEESEDE